MKNGRVLEEVRGVLINKIEKEPRIVKIQKNVIVQWEMLIQVSWLW